jgi:hypothetical protein
MAGAFDNRLKEALEVLAGFRGKAGDAAVRRKDLVRYDNVIEKKNQIVLEKLDDTETELTNQYTGINAELADTVNKLAQARIDIDQAMADLDATEIEVAQARADIVAADALATGVRNDHDALTASFSGTLTDAFEARDTLITEARERIGLAEHTIAAQVPVMRSVEDAIDTISQSVARLNTVQHDIAGRIADAGIYVDEADGTVHIYAVDQVAGRTSDAEIRLDAAEANINLRATYTYVDDQIATAVIDPSQIPIFDDLLARINTVEVDLDAAEAAITLKADSTTLDGYDVRLSEAEIDIDGLQGEIALKVDRTEFDDAETRLTSAEQTLSNIDGASISQNVMDVREHGRRLDRDELQTLEDLLTFYENREVLRRELAFVTQDIHARVTEEGEAIATQTSSLGAQIDNANALITNEQAVRAAADEAMALDITTLQADVGNFSATLSQEYYTISQADQAISSAISSFETEFRDPATGQIRATALTQYYTKTGTDDAISAVETTLSGEIQRVEDNSQAGHFQHLLDATEAVTVGAAVTVSEAAGAFGQDATLIVREGGTARTTNGATNGANFRLPEALRTHLMGRRVKISVLAKKPATNPATNFSVAYSTNSEGNSGALSLGPLQPDYAWYSAYYDLPSGGAETDDFIGIFGDDSKTNKGVQIARVLVARSAEAEELPEISNLSADISDVLGLEVTPTHAFGQWVQDIGVSVADPNNPGQTLSARTSLTASAVADIEGNLSSVIGFKAQAGNSVSLLSLVAASDPSGASYSLAKLSADNIILDGTVGTEKLVVGLGRNMLPNADFSAGLTHWAVDLRSGSVGTDSELSVRTPGESWAGPKTATLMIRQPSNAATGYFRAGCLTEDANGTLGYGVDVEDEEWYEIQARVSTHRCTGRLLMQFYSDNGSLLSSTFSEYFAVNASSSTNPNQWPRYWVKAQAPTGAAYMTFKVDKHGTQSGSDSFLFLHHPQAALTTASAGQASAWSPGTTTVIDGGQVRTNTLHGDKIIGRTITGDHIAGNSITAFEADFESLSALGLTVGNADIVGDIKSDDFAAGSAGWRIRKSGSAEFNDITIRRQLVLAQGSFAPGGTASEGTEYRWVNTGIRIGKHDVWRASDITLLATAAITSGASGPSNIDPNNAFWSCEAVVSPGARWNGYVPGQPQPNISYRQDPATLITPSWATGTDMRVFLRIRVFSEGGPSFPNPLIQWKVFHVS